VNSRSSEIPALLYCQLIVGQYALLRRSFSVLSTASTLAGYPTLLISLSIYVFEKSARLGPTLCLTTRRLFPASALSNSRKYERRQHLGNAFTVSFTKQDKPLLQTESSKVLT